MANPRPSVLHAAHSHSRAESVASRVDPGAHAEASGIAASGRDRVDADSGDETQQSEAATDYDYLDAGVVRATADPAGVGVVPHASGGSGGAGAAAAGGTAVADGGGDAAERREGSRDDQPIQVGVADGDSTTDKGRLRAANAGTGAPPSPDLNLSHVPGAEWIDPATGARRRRAKNGQLQEWRITSGRYKDITFGKWIFIPDPDKPATRHSLNRQRRKARQAAGLPNAALGDQKRGTGVVPFEVKQDDRLRIKLRDRQRKQIKDGTAPVDLPTLPGFQSLSFATRYIDGGRDKFLEFVQLAVLEEYADAIKWWSVFADLLPYERETVSLDDVTAAAGVRPSRLMSIVVSCAMEMGRDVGNLIAAMTHPLVVAAATKSAQVITGEDKDIGFKDRQMLFQHHNFIPAPKGTTVNVNANASAKAAAAAAADPSVPKFGNDLRQVGVPAVAGALPPGENLPSFMQAPVADAVTIDVSDDEDDE